MYPVVVSAAGKDEKVGMRKGGKTKKTAFRQTEKPYFFISSQPCGKRKNSSHYETKSDKSHCCDKSQQN